MPLHDFYGIEYLWDYRKRWEGLGEWLTRWNLSSVSSTESWPVGIVVSSCTAYPQPSRASTCKQTLLSPRPTPRRLLGSRAMSSPIYRSAVDANMNRLSNSSAKLLTSSSSGIGRRDLLKMECSPCRTYCSMSPLTISFSISCKVIFA